MPLKIGVSSAGPPGNTHPGGHPPSPRCHRRPPSKPFLHGADRAAEEGGVLYCPGPCPMHSLPPSIQWGRGERVPCCQPGSCTASSVVTGGGTAQPPQGPVPLVRDAHSEIAQLPTDAVPSPSWKVVGRSPGSLRELALAALVCLQPGGWGGAWDMQPPLNLQLSGHRCTPWPGKWAPWSLCVMGCHTRPSALSGPQSLGRWVRQTSLQRRPRPL